ncbi:hypothetical protein Tco_0168821 [Tanacetum coccineum]
MEDFGNKGLREGSAVSGSSRGEPLKSILKKSSYKPLNFVGADGLMRDAGIDSVVPLNMEGSPSLGQKRVSMAPLVTVRVFRPVESEVSLPEEGNAMPFIGMNEPAISEAIVRSTVAVDIINTSMADGVDGKNWTCGKDVTEDATCMVSDLIYRVIQMDVVAATDPVRGVLNGSDDGLKGVNNGAQVDARANRTFVGTIIRAMQDVRGDPDSGIGGHWRSSDSVLPLKISIVRGQYNISTAAFRDI